MGNCSQQQAKALSPASTPVPEQKMKKVPEVLSENTDVGCDESTMKWRCGKRPGLPEDFDSSSIESCGAVAA
ncbi:hypothetical protein DIPPA_12351 [Diplonema papillatum]|nr:hypothetical protein DIPPA_12351 [Diplonema papillatum]